ncbi:MAG: superinfection exclusion B family protein [Psychromonas sp.]|nr:superinfection exclusion B family protein [Psychromonas sp.]
MSKLIKKFKGNNTSIGLVMWLFFLSMFFVFIPPSIFNKVGIVSLLVAFNPYAFIIALISGAFLFKELISRLFRIYSSKIACRKIITARLNMISSLDFEEKAILREFVIQKKNVLSLPLTEPAVANLLSAGVLESAFETQEIKGRSRLIKLSIAIDARHKLTHIVLGLPAGALTKDQAKTLKSARPSYARSNYIALRD